MCRLVRRIMKDVRVRILAHLRRENINCIFEGGFLLNRIMGPKRLERRGRSPIYPAVYAKRIFKPVARERIAFHIEEEIAGVRWRQVGKAASRLDRKQL